MIRSTIALLAILTSVFAWADDAEDAGAKLHEYFAEFNKKNVERIANHVYATPLQIGGGNAHRVLADPAAAVANLTGLYEQIESQGWVESRIDNLKICMASDTLALVDTRYSRIDQDGEPIPPAIRTTLYMLQKFDGDWRIVAFYGHDSSVRPGCE
jgi:ketosteroid isomerase-like protein